jgi:hypothetical protein
MTMYTTIHLHNVVPGRQTDFAEWFDGPHRDDLSRLRGFCAADRFELTAEQVMPDIPQPWRFLSVYEFDYPVPEIDLPALGPLLAGPRDAGLTDDAGETERLYSYAMYSDWRFSPNHRPDQPFSGVSILLGNYTVGREAEYHQWYDDVHAPEVTRVPGKVAMKRGRLAELQIAPRRYCPGSELVYCAQQTNDLAFTIQDFIDRARGASPSGVAFQPRSKAGSLARTVHYFRRISGEVRWGGGIAYQGDLSVYPKRG